MVWGCFGGPGPGGLTGPFFRSKLEYSYLSDFSPFLHLKPKIEFRAKKRPRKTPRTPQTPPKPYTQNFCGVLGFQEKKAKNRENGYISLHKVIFNQTSV